MFISFIVAVVFSALAANGNSIIFNSSIKELSDKYNLDISPAHWTFAIWGIIYVVIAANLGLIMYTILRKNKFGLIYITPVVFCPTVCMIVSVTFYLSVLWQFIWDMELIVASSYIHCLIALANVAGVWKLIQNVERNNHQLKFEQPYLYWCYVIVGINGYSIYAAWTMVECLTNFTLTLYHKDNISMQSASLANLSLLCIVVTFGAIADLLFFDHNTRFLVSPYLTFIWHLAGILSEKNFESSVPKDTKAFLNALIGLLIIVSSVKVYMVFYKQLKSPFKRR